MLKFTAFLYDLVYNEYKKKGRVEMADYKIIFSDIDGTVLDNNHQVLPSTTNAVQQLCKKQFPFVLVSARMPKAMRTITNEIGVTIPLISYGGALVMDENKNILYDNRMTLKDTSEIIDEIQSRWGNDVTINYYADDDWYAEDVSCFAVVREEKITSVNAEQKAFDDLLKENILPNKLLCITTPEVCEEMEKALSSKYGNLQIVRSSPILLEIMNDGIKKSQGISVLLKHLNLKTEQAIAFGDNYNDVDMLKAVGLGVAMQNAPQDVQQLADMVTDSNENDGIYNCLKKLNIVD